MANAVERQMLGALRGIQAAVGGNESTLADFVEIMPEGSGSRDSGAMIAGPYRRVVFEVSGLAVKPEQPEADKPQKPSTVKPAAVLKVSAYLAEGKRMPIATMSIGKDGFHTLELPFLSRLYSVEVLPDPNSVLTTTVYAI